MKKYISFLLFFLLSYVQATSQQTVTLEQCHKWAILNAPTFLQMSKYERLSDIKQKDAIWSYLPKFEINGQASYRNPVIKVETSVPELSNVFPVFQHDQYHFTFDLTMPIYDGGITQNTKKYNKLTSDIDLAKSEITLFQLQENINTIYLNIFFTDENLDILNLHLNNLTSDIEKVKALINNNVVLKSNADILEAEKLKIEQQKVELVSQRKYLIGMLSEYTGKDLSTSTLLLPEVALANTELTTTRPEIESFLLQIESLDYRKKLISGDSYPKLDVFATGGYARPTYNFFDINFGWQYMVGAKFKIPIMNWFKTKMGTNYISIQQNIIDLQQDDYKMNNRIQMMQKLTDIEKYSQIIEQDSAIVEKYKNVTIASQRQLEEGVITANDYLKELNNYTEALLKQRLHKLQLLQAKIEFNALKGNLSTENNQQPSN